jgi:hypothetical protein
MTLPDGDIAAQLIDDGSREPPVPQLAQELKAIQHGTAPRGQYPAIEGIIHRRYNHFRKVHAAARPPRRRPRASQYVSDVTPSVRERLAVTEHITLDLQQDFEEHRSESIRWAEQAEQKYATKEELNEQQKQIDELKKTSLVKVVLVTISAAGTVAAIIWYAVQLGSKLHI